MRSLGDEISKVLEQTIKESKALDVESLNIKIGKYCWDVELELNLISYEGNILDAMNYAAMALLLKFEFRKVSVENQELVVGDQIKQFSLNHIPILQTFAIFNGEKDLVVLDPTAEEEEICNGLLVIAVNVYGDICFIHKPGNSIIDMELLMNLIQLCVKKSKEIGFTFKKFVDVQTVTFGEVF